MKSEAGQGPNKRQLSIDNENTTEEDRQLTVQVTQIWVCLLLYISLFTFGSPAPLTPQPPHPTRPHPFPSGLACISGPLLCRLAVSPSW